MNQTVNHDEATVTIYFLSWDSNTRHDILVPRYRSVREGTVQELLTQAISELLTGPSPNERQLGDVSAIPPGTRLHGARIEGDVAIVDLSEEIESGGGSASVRARIYQIVYTGTAIPGIRFVQITINGERREALAGEGLIIGEPLERLTTPPRF